MTKKLLLIFSVLSFALPSLAQEFVHPLQISSEEVDRYEKERFFEPREDRYSRDGAIELPFIDDFSRYSLPTNDPSIPVEWQMWLDNDARINNTLPINVPTIGVATFDGLDETGYPYDFTSETSYGPADTLTSCPINLDGLTAADSVKLVFHYQAGGMGNIPEYEDSLVLEFLVEASDPPLWQEAWSKPGTSVTNFQREIVHVDNAFWLHSNAQFRFRNYSTLSGMVDLWHIDYVYLDQDIIDADFKLIDIAASGHESSLLANYQSMPWEHFQSNPVSFMEDDEQVIFNNLDDDRNITFGARVLFEGVEQAVLSQNASTAANGFSFIERQFSINDGNPNNFVFDENIADTCATFEVQYYCNTSPDIRASNDTLTFEQHFGNYYAHDDGSAELAYGVYQSGSKIALRYNNAVEDSLLGLLISFVPYGLNNTDEQFLLRAWHDEGGSVGEQFEEQFQTLFPEYFMDGNDLFKYYAYENAINIPAGPFFVGLVQSTDAELNIGLDRHNNVNTNNLFFTSGAGGAWTQTSIEGALMVRPVFQTDKPLEWDFVSIDEIGIEAKAFSVYPNPSSSLISSGEFGPGKSLTIINSLGAIVREEQLLSTQVEISELAQGVYIIQLFENGQFLKSARFIKN